MIFGFKAKNAQLILLLVAIFLFLYKSWKQQIIFTDELYIIDAAKSMSQGGSLIVPHVNNLVNFTKPPLIYWLLIPFFKLGVPYILSGRILMSLFATGCLILIYKYANLVFDTTTAIWSGVFLATSVTFIYLTKATNIDLPFTFFFLAVLYSYHLGKNRAQWYWVSGLLLGIAALMRSFFIIFPLGVILFDLILSHSISRFKIFLVIIASALIIGLPWHLLAFIQSPTFFTQDYLNLVIFHHLIGTIPGDASSSIFYYFRILVLFPPSILALLYLTGRKLKTLSQSEKLLLFWVLWEFLTLTVSPTRHEWYFISLLPPLAILAGKFFRDHFLINPDSFRNFFLKLITGAMILSPPVMLIFLPFPEAPVVSAVNALEKASNNQDIIYEINYPLVPETSFYPNRKIEITSTVSLDYIVKNQPNTYIIARTEDLKPIRKSYLMTKLFEDVGISAYRITRAEAGRLTCITGSVLCN